MIFTSDVVLFLCLRSRVVSLGFFVTEGVSDSSSICFSLASRAAIFAAVLGNEMYPKQCAFTRHILCQHMQLMSVVKDILY